MIIFFFFWILAIGAALFFLSEIKNPYTKNSLWQTMVPGIVIVFSVTMLRQEFFAAMPLWGKAMLIFVFLGIIAACHQFVRFCPQCGAVIFYSSRPKCRKCTAPGNQNG